MPCCRCDLCLWPWLGTLSLLGSQTHIPVPSKKFILNKLIWGTLFYRILLFFPCHTLLFFSLQYLISLTYFNYPTRMVLSNCMYISNKLYIFLQLKKLVRGEKSLIILGEKPKNFANYYIYLSNSVITIENVQNYMKLLSKSSKIH